MEVFWQSRYEPTCTFRIVRSPSSVALEVFRGTLENTCSTTVGRIAPLALSPIYVLWTCLMSNPASRPYLRNSTAWDPGGDDLGTCDDFLRYTMDKALDIGMDSIDVLDHAAETILQRHCPASVSSTRVADLLLGHLEMN